MGKKVWVVWGVSGGYFNDVREAPFFFWLVGGLHLRTPAH